MLLVEEKHERLNDGLGELTKRAGRVLYLLLDRRFRGGVFGPIFGRTAGFRVLLLVEFGLGGAESGNQRTARGERVEKNDRNDGDPDGQSAARGMWFWPKHNEEKARLVQTATRRQGFGSGGPPCSTAILAVRFRVRTLRAGSPCYS